MDPSRAPPAPSRGSAERARAARPAPRPIPPRGVRLVPGPLRQGRGLPSDVVSPLGGPPPPRRRRTPQEQAWELPAYDRYDDEVDPVSLADAVVLADSPDHLALVLQGRFS